MENCCSVGNCYFAQNISKLSMNFRDVDCNLDSFSSEEGMT